MATLIMMHSRPKSLRKQQLLKKRLSAQVLEVEYLTVVRATI